MSVGLASTGTGRSSTRTSKQTFDVVAAGLLLVGQVASTRFHDPATATRLAEPIIDGRRHGPVSESLSACCGVAARLDLPADGMRDDADPGDDLDLRPEMQNCSAACCCDPMRVRVADTKDSR